MYTIEFKWGYRTSVPITASPLLPPGFQGHHWAPTWGAREVGGGRNFKGTPGLNHLNHHSEMVLGKPQATIWFPVSP